ncbi:hypothetical protein PFY12_07845 [Chryseobacterium camelliae]|uniref:Peptidoglycan-binding protein LysM n=1 Tax=Chryseobacterium camelliae TaxID=1265445 RepID=A0ABY7QIZ5_9FLAO|nr:hypothetical protein [Chryseobacterium camelliae]WBV58986.1 hypothetical protein PFY12_07845 [Chryseobacterium camelliae]
MKRLNLSVMVLSIAFVAISANVKAQDDKDDTHTIAVGIPEVALVDIESATSKNISMGFTAPTEAGLPLTTPADNSTLWLNYSSIKTSTGADTSRTISVKLSPVIVGVDVKVAAAAYSGSGEGTVGTPSSPLTLTTTDQPILTGIGSVYTGNGVSNGHNLTYSVNYGTTGGTAVYADLVANPTASTTVTYTISDN